MLRSRYVGVGERAVDREVLEVHGPLAQPAPVVAPALDRPQTVARRRRRVELFVCPRVDARHAFTLRRAVPGEPFRVVRARLGPRPPAVGGVVHVELGNDRSRIALVGDGRVDRLQHELALARVRSHADPRVAAAVLGVRQRRQRTAAAVPEQHNRLGAAARAPIPPPRQHRARPARAGSRCRCSDSASRSRTRRNPAAASSGHA